MPSLRDSGGISEPVCYLKCRPSGTRGHFPDLGCYLKCRPSGTPAWHSCPTQFEHEPNIYSSGPGGGEAIFGVFYASKPLRVREL